MRHATQHVAARFGPDTRFEVSARTEFPFRATQLNELELLKGRLLGDALEEGIPPDLNARLRRAANEAAALAWVSPYPLLFFPELFREKSDSARRQAARQARIRSATRRLNGTALVAL
jgi:hypothetical protein